jgi:hypothetical protein
LLLVGTGHFHLNELRFVQLGFLAEIKGRVHLSAQITPETREMLSVKQFFRIFIRQEHFTWLWRE